MEKIQLPLSVRLLFNNSELDAITTLCVLSGINKKMNIRHLIFYYSIAISDLDDEVLQLLLDESKQTVETVISRTGVYFDYYDKVRNLLLYLCNHGVVDIYSKKEAGSFLDLSCKVSKLGIAIQSEINSPHLIEITQRAKFAFENIKLSSRTERIVKEF